MRVTIYQPQYFPRLHYFNRILTSDVFVILDSAQYTKSLVHIEGQDKKRHKSYQADAPIKTASGLFLLTVPVKDHQLSINQTAVEYLHNWVPKHIQTMRSAYSRAPMFEPVFGQIKDLLAPKYPNLADLNTKTIIWGISALLGLSVDLGNLTFENLNKNLKKSKCRLKKVIFDSETQVKRPEGLHKGTEWTAAICHKLGASEYFHGGTAKEGYMQADYYQKLGIKTVVQNWQCPVYLQQFSDKVGFIANLSVIDLVFNVGQKQAQKIIGA